MSGIMVAAMAGGFAALAASASPASLANEGITGTPAGSVSVNAGSTTASASGGSGSFTYAWAYVSGDSATISAAASATTSFTRNAAAPGSPGSNVRSGVFRCTATDTVTGQTATANVTVQTTHTYTP